MMSRSLVRGRTAAPAAAAAAAVLVVLILTMTSIASCGKTERPPLLPAGYGNWRTTTDVRLDYPIPGHEDRFRVIRMNEKGFQFSGGASAPGGFAFPEGTIIAKDIYAVSNPGPDDKPVMVTAMVKAKSDPDARGGWLWVVKDLGKDAETVMTGDFCVRCHANANEAHPYGWKNPGAAFADYVFFIPGTSTEPTSDGY